MASNKLSALSAVSGSLTSDSLVYIADTQDSGSSYSSKKITVASLLSDVATTTDLGTFTGTTIDNNQSIKAALQALETALETESTNRATAISDLVDGAPALLDTLNETAPEWALKKTNSVLSENTVDAITKLGPACSISSALPSVLYLALKYENDIENAFIENAMAGGDNCARGLALGILLGAANGFSSIPRKWIDSLMADKELENFLNPSNPDL